MNSRFAKSISPWLSNPFIIPIAFILFWSLYISPQFIDPLYKGMIASRVEDLSKTLVETTGILTSFLAVAGFYYLGKMGDLFIVKDKAD